MPLSRGEMFVAQMISGSFIDHRPRHIGSNKAAVRAPVKAKKPKDPACRHRRRKARPVGARANVSERRQRKSCFKDVTFGAFVALSATGAMSITCGASYFALAFLLADLSGSTPIALARLIGAASVVFAASLMAIFWLFNLVLAAMIAGKGQRIYL